LYQLYEIQNRNVEEHEAFSFQIERENLKWLYNANQDFSKEMNRVNLLEDLDTHYNLNGLIFKKKMLDPQKLKGLGFFGVPVAVYAFYPYVVASLGQSWTTSLMTAACLSGMYMLRQNETIVNTIEMMEDGKLKFNVSDSLVASKDIIVAVKDTHSLISLSNDDLGEDDIESNYL